ncbi:hypothetical protein [Aquimarina megaterium]|nr:hypothetical protein [Aquimarina megaterium]
MKTSRIVILIIGIFVVFLNTSCTVDDVDRDLPISQTENEEDPPLDPNP